MNTSGFGSDIDEDSLLETPSRVPSTSHPNPLTHPHLYSTLAGPSTSHPPSPLPNPANPAHLGSGGQEEYYDDPELSGSDRDAESIRTGFSSDISIPLPDPGQEPIRWTPLSPEGGMDSDAGSEPAESTRRIARRQRYLDVEAEIDGDSELEMPPPRRPRRNRPRRSSGSPWPEPDPADMDEDADFSNDPTPDPNTSRNSHNSRGSRKSPPHESATDEQFAEWMYAEIGLNPASRGRYNGGRGWYGEEEMGEGKKHGVKRVGRKEKPVSHQEFSTYIKHHLHHTSFLHTPQTSTFYPSEAFIPPRALSSHHQHHVQANTYPQISRPTGAGVRGGRAGAGRLANLLWQERGGGGLSGFGIRVLPIGFEAGEGRRTEGGVAGGRGGDTFGDVKMD